MKKPRKPILEASVTNPRRRPRPRAKWRYEGPESATAWIDRAHGQALVLKAASVLMDGRYATARAYRESSELLLQGIICVMKLQEAK